MKTILVLIISFFLISPVYADDIPTSVDDFYSGWIFGADIGLSIPVAPFDATTGPDGSNTVYDFDCHRIAYPICGNGPLNESLGWLASISVYHALPLAIPGRILLGMEVVGNLSQLNMSGPENATPVPPYASNTVDASRGAHQGTFASLMILPLSIQYHPWNGRFNPYVTAGIGLNLNEVNLDEDLQRNASPSTGQNLSIGLPTTLALKGGIGFDYILTSSFALNAEMGAFMNQGFGTVEALSSSLLPGSIANGVPFNASAIYLMGGVKF